MEESEGSPGTYSDRLHRPRSASLQSTRSRPQLPVLQLTTTNSNHSQQVAFEPTTNSSLHLRSGVERDTHIACEPIAGLDSRSSTDSSLSANEKENEPNYDSTNKQRKLSSIDSRKSNGMGRQGSADTLVEAALDQQEARDRHVRFPDHIAEAGSLVQRMLSTRINNSGERASITNDETLEDPELGSISSSRYNQPSTGGGSVLASLLKLEAQRRSSLIEREELKRKKKKKKVNGTNSGYLRLHKNIIISLLCYLILK
ncbi:hypothetical protein K501DRAFT_12786 [Backusella circina FSU 941]|nr:hypothetical protein K501DRAFT_12786 [Backusella circina FSU 941]